jgi:hypothetical protein
LYFATSVRRFASALSSRGVLFGEPFGRPIDLSSPGASNKGYLYHIFWMSPEQWARRLRRQRGIPVGVGQG